MDDLNFSADIIAKFDQAQQGLEMHAKIVADYYKSLIENGIPFELAYRLCLDMQKVLMPGSRSR